MSDQDFDPCECVSPHEVAMRRLLSLLRQSQSYCTDIECYQSTNVSNPRNITGHDFLFTCVMTVLALFVFFYQVQNARNNNIETTKRQNGNEGNGAPPGSSSPTY